MRKIAILFLILFVGCTGAKTSMKADDPFLKPLTLKGTPEEIHELTYEAAKKAFPEEDAIFKHPDNKVVIERDWFWRGDTIIEVFTKKLNDQECVVSAESRGNWHRGNAPIFDMSTDELKYYMKILKEEYENSLAAADKSPTNSALIQKLETLKQAYEQGLINEEEYVYKRKKLLENY
jgi:hypothetical protein